jgi:hypothetical protein
MTSLPMTETTAFQRQRDAVDYTHSVGDIRRTDAMGQLDLDQGLAEYSQGQQFRQARNQLPGQFAQRGLLNSGFYKGALQDFGVAQTDALSALQNDFGRQRNDLVGQLGALDANRMIGLADIDLNQTQRRSAIASVLQGVS